MRGADSGAAEAAHEPEHRRAFVASGYAVFNADQVEDWTPSAMPMLPESERIGAADRFFARIVSGGNSACYLAAIDEIRMPPFGTSTARSTMPRPSRTS